MHDAKRRREGRKMERGNRKRQNGSEQANFAMLVWVNESGVVRVYVCELNEKVSSSCCPVNVDYVVAA